MLANRFNGIIWWDKWYTDTKPYTFEEVIKNIAIGDSLFGVKKVMVLKVWEI